LLAEHRVEERRRDLEHLGDVGRRGHERPASSVDLVGPQLNVA
jgi:hypothetical protein